MRMVTFIFIRKTLIFLVVVVVVAGVVAGVVVVVVCMRAPHRSRCLAKDRPSGPGRSRPDHRFDDYANNGKMPKCKANRGFGV